MTVCCQRKWERNEGVFHSTLLVGRDGARRIGGGGGMNKAWYGGGGYTGGAQRSLQPAVVGGGWVCGEGAKLHEGLNGGACTDKQAKAPPSTGCSRLLNLPILDASACATALVHASV